MHSVDIEDPAVEYTTEGYASHISKDIEQVQREIDVSYGDFVSDGIPVSAFAGDLSPLQAIVRHLRERRNLNFSEIGRLLDRNPRTIWSTYDACKELPLPEAEGERIPADVFADRKLSTLECLVRHLLSRGKKVGEIASLLGKGYQTIWTVKRRIAEKGGGADE